MSHPSSTSSSDGAPPDAGAAGVLVTDHDHAGGPTLPAGARGGRRRVPAGQAIAVTLLALLLAALANGTALQRLAAQQPFGTARDLARTAADGAQAVGDALGIDLVRRALDEALDREAAVVEADEFGAGVERAAPPPTSVAPPTTGSNGRDVPPPGSAAPSTTAPTTTTTTLPERRVPSAADPLRVLFAGDSLMGTIAIGFERAVRDDPRIAVASDYRVGTGLARPDVLDWPTHLSGLADQHAAEVVVLMFGGNDDQDMATPEGRAVVFSEAWQREYQRRVGIMMDVARTADRTVVWLGLPAMNRQHLEEGRQMMNQIALVEARKRPEVRFVDLSATLTPDGAFRPHIEGHRVREGDGVHVTVTGAELVAPRILAAFAPERLPAP